MKDQQSHYRRLELEAVDPSNLPIRLKITSERGETRWLNITMIEFKAITKVLTPKERTS